MIILADNDEPGEQLAYQVMQDLQLISNSVRIIKPIPDVDKADITDYFEAGHTVEEFENLIRNVDDTESICAEVQQDQKQNDRKKNEDRNTKKQG